MLLAVVSKVSARVIHRINLLFGHIQATRPTNQVSSHKESDSNKVSTAHTKTDSELVCTYNNITSIIGYYVNDLVDICLQCVSHLTTESDNKFFFSKPLMCCTLSLVFGWLGLEDKAVVSFRSLTSPNVTLFVLLMQLLSVAHCRLALPTYLPVVDQIITSITSMAAAEADTTSITGHTGGMEHNNCRMC
jgi:hypothetical protein